MEITRAISKDKTQVLELLNEVLEIHHNIRPDIFMSGKTKYTEEMLDVMFKDDNNPIYVAREGDKVLGYAFCELHEVPFSTTMVPHRSLFIDDLCVNQNIRSKGVGKALFEHVKSEAKRLGCYEVTLNVWEGNESAINFYKKMNMQIKEYQMEYILDKD